MEAEAIMLDDRQKAALKRWYERSEVLDEARQCIAKEYWTDLEEHIQMRSLFPLLRIEDLPDSLKTDEGEALLPSLNPRDNQDAWEDAIGVGWSVVEAELGVSHDDVHRAIAAQQKDDWASFMASVEKRKKEREG
jgi:hypothetical protein